MKFTNEGVDARVSPGISRFYLLTCRLTFVLPEATENDVTSLICMLRQFVLQNIGDLVRVLHPALPLLLYIAFMAPNQAMIFGGKR